MITWTDLLKIRLRFHHKTHVGHCCAGIIIINPTDDILEMMEPVMGSPSPNTYICKRLNRKTGMCMDYENRPDMCKRFPASRGYVCPVTTDGWKCKFKNKCLCR